MTTTPALTCIYDTAWTGRSTDPEVGQLRLFLRLPAWTTLFALLLGRLAWVIFMITSHFIPMHFRFGLKTPQAPFGCRASRKRMVRAGGASQHAVPPTGGTKGTS
jgi:hypothetical protein